MTGPSQFKGTKPAIQCIRFLVDPANNRAGKGLQNLDLSTSTPSTPPLQFQVRQNSLSPVTGWPNACLDFCRKSSGVPARCGQWEPGKLNKSDMKHLEGVHPTISVFQSVPPHLIMFQEHCFYRRIYSEGHLPNFSWAQMPLGAAQ